MASARHAGPVPFTLVSFHAHPDDEALLTGGTLARVTSEGSPRGPGDGDGRRRRTDVVRPRARPRAVGDARSSRPPRPTSASPASCCSATRTAGSRTRVSTGPPRSSPRCCGRSRRTCSPATTSTVATATPTTCTSTASPDGPERSRVRRSCSRPASTGRGCCAPTASCGGCPGCPGSSRSATADVYLARTELTHRVDVRDQVPAKTRRCSRTTARRRGSEAAHGLLPGADSPGPSRRRVLGREWFREVGPTRTR